MFYFYKFHLISKSLLDIIEIKIIKLWEIPTKDRIRIQSYAALKTSSHVSSPKKSIQVADVSQSLKMLNSANSVLITKSFKRAISI